MSVFIYERNEIMRRLHPTVCVALLLSVVVSCGWGISAIADCSLSDCDNNGAIEVGCGNGRNACVGNDEEQGNADEARVLHTGPFECGPKDGWCSCITSSTWTEKCYTEYADCDFDEKEGCNIDEDTGDPHYDWIKIADECYDQSS